VRIVIPGGSGQVGTILARHLHAAGHRVTVLSRNPKPAPWQTLRWDGATLSPSWTDSLEDAGAVIHLSGRSVNCRYTPENRREIIDSRVVPTLLLGRAIEQAQRPPKVWMNASTSTFYRHTLDRPQDEFTREIGGDEPGAPDTWNFSIDVARRWEGVLRLHHAGHTQDRAALVDDHEPRRGRRLLRALEAGANGAGRHRRLGKTVRLVDPRPRLLPRHRVRAHAS
jgi:NAD dependent epimerase/dehydratase family enzyme